MRRMKWKAFVVALGLTIAAPAVFAAEEEEAPAEETGGIKDWIPGTLSGTVGFFSDYNFRGVSQTQREMALQGGITYTHPTGLFFSTWGSNVHFDLPSSETMLEQDFIGGYGGAFGDFSYSVAATFFYYPLQEVFNYWEFAINTGYNFGFMSVSAGFIGSPDYFGTLDTGMYIPVGFQVPIPWENDYVTLKFDQKGGYTHTDRLIFTDPETHHYWDWSTALIVGLPFNLALDLRYVGTDVSEIDDADHRFVVGGTFSF